MGTLRAVRHVTLAYLALAPLLVDPSGAQTQPSEAPVLVQGGFSQAVPLEVPAFRGVEPRLALSYSSERGNGFVGVGWGLSGLSLVVRTKGGRGVPRFDASDVFLLDGHELVPCGAAMTSPGCAAGGTHATKSESYLRIRLEDDTWRVWGRDGTVTVLEAVHATSRGTLRWGQTRTTDTHGNTAAYHWSCADGDCYPGSIAFGPYSVRFYRESRADVLTFATGDPQGLGRTAHRLRSVLVLRGETAIRAYKLTYEGSPATGRSVLVEVQQHGHDVVIDSSGQITGGSVLPPRSFRYQGSAAGEVFPAAGR